MNPESELDRRHSSPSFGAHGLPALGAASLDAARIGTVSPSAPKHGTDCLALNFGFQDKKCEICGSNTVATSLPRVLHFPRAPDFSQSLDGNPMKIPEEIENV